jgi:large subunit ribosomal protein L35
MRKTHKGIAKRFKVTGTGKVTHRKPGQRHLRRKKTNKQVQAGRQNQVLAPGMAKRVINALSS